MPLELQIIRASEFVRMGPKNHLDMDETKLALVLLARACRQRGIDQAMMDLRQVAIPEKPLFTPTQIAELVNTFQHAGFGHEQRLAIPGRLGRVVSRRRKPARVRNAGCAIGCRCWSTRDRPVPPGP